jgi:hypothetical protein
VEKRGFQFHFIGKVVVQIPNIEILTYNMYESEYENGWPCHGKHDTSGESRYKHKPRLSRNIVSYVESFFFFEVCIDTVCKIHIKKYFDMDAIDRDRDFFLCRKDVANIYNRLMKRNYQLNKKDEKSVNLWYEKHKDNFFFYQKPNGEYVPFLDGIQTKWMLDTMVRLSHNNIIAMDSTFNTNKYRVSVFSMIDLV